MGMSGMYGPADRDESIATIHAALDAGITLLDTGDFYGMGHNELLIARGARAAATATRSCSASSSARCATRPTAGRGIDARPAAVKNFARLLAHAGWAPTTSTSTGRRASIPTCRSRRPSAPSRAGRGRLRAPHRAVRGRRRDDPPRRRRAPDRRPADRVLAASRAGSRTRSSPTCRELGIGITAYGVLSRGLLCGPLVRPAATCRRATSAPTRRASSGENLERNLALVEALREVADDARRDRRPAGDRLGALAAATTSCR